MNRQMTLAEINDELGAAKNKKEILPFRFSYISPHQQKLQSLYHICEAKTIPTERSDLCPS